MHKFEPVEIPEKITPAFFQEHIHFTDNSKAGITLDMPAMDSCPGMTEACLKKITKKDGKEGKYPTCYALQGLYKWSQDRFRQNRDLIEKAIDQWGQEEAARLTYQEFKRRKFLKGLLTGAQYLEIFKKLRFHGSGDCYSIKYIKFLIELAKLMEADGFGIWLYTRSFIIPTLLPALRLLASRPNVNMLLSADYWNYQEAINVIESDYNQVFTGIACMHHAGDIWPEAVQNTGRLVVLFPVHVGKQNIQERLTGMAGNVKTCPAILGAWKDDRACLKCTNICTTSLPASVH